MYFHPEFMNITKNDRQDTQTHASQIQKTIKLFTIIGLNANRNTCSSSIDYQFSLHTAYLSKIIYLGVCTRAFFFMFIYRTAIDLDSINLN